HDALPICEAKAEHNDYYVNHYHYLLKPHERRVAELEQEVQVVDDIALYLASGGFVVESGTRLLLRATPIVGEVTYVAGGVSLFLTVVNRFTVDMLERERELVETYRTDLRYECDRIGKAHPACQNLMCPQIDFGGGRTAWYTQDSATFSSVLGSDDRVRHCMCQHLGGT